MDIAKIIDELRSERDRLDGIISALERFGVEGRISAGPKRRGRKFMDKAGRQEVSERMKRYWADRRRGGVFASVPSTQAQAASASESSAAS